MLLRIILHGKGNFGEGDEISRGKAYMGDFARISIQNYWQIS